MKSLIYLFLFIGSAVGSYLPVLWGGSLFSVTSVMLGGVGALLGIWVGFKLYQRLGL